jgi:hypothetical protein
MPLSKIDSDSLNTPITAADLAYTGTLTGSTGIVNIGSGQVYKDASGNVGIGTSSPSGKLNISGTSTTARITGTDGVAILRYNNGTSDVAQLVIAGGNTLLDYQGAMQFRAGVNGSEVARIDSSGATYFNCTTSPTGNGTGAGGLNVLNTSGDTFNVKCTTSGNNIFNLWSTGTSTNNMFAFLKGDGKANVGNIVTTTSATSYVTSSDYRLKNTIAPMTGALAKVALLKPVTYKWNVDGSDGQGFIAHELDEVVPGCVTGAKDAIDADGNPQYQGIDTSFLVATLTAAIQELKAIVDAQGAEIAALKGTP